ncbi:MAG TPA: hypothetical protein VFL17_01160, partial [Anaerolineae bacterium]|nr:hypothetical protein [Anaerolineae bacterium]
MFNYLARLTIALALVMTPATPPVAGMSLARGVAGQGYRATATTPPSASLPRVPSLQRYETPGGRRLMLPPPHIVEGRSAGPVKSSLSGPLLLSPVRIVESRSDRTVERPAAWPGPLPPARVLQSAPITEVRICNTSDGCDALVTPTLATDSPLVLYAAGYGGNQFVENLPVTWTVPASLTPAPSEGVSTTLDGSAPGNFVVTATVIATPTLWSTSMLTVTTGALSSVVIRDAPLGDGNVVTDATRTAGTAWPLYAAGYDADDNFIADQVVTWTLDGDIGSSPPEVASSTIFTAGTVGTGSITAEASESITDSTGTITVVYGAPD